MIAVTDQLLDILKYGLLGLLYLFFARVLWAVWSEVRWPGAVTARPGPRRRRITPAARPADRSARHDRGRRRRRPPWPP